MANFFNRYFKYAGISEVPPTFHRWSAISLLGAVAARNVYFPFGHSKIYPNQYILLTGSPGARKGSAIKVAANLLKEIKYPFIAPNRASKEGLWRWMEEKLWEHADPLDGDDAIAEAYIAHDEFIDFIGFGDEGILTNLTNLWDNLRKYEYPKARGEKIEIPNPTLNILSGITPKGISEAFRGLALGGGFFSRVLFIYSEPARLKVAFPESSDMTLAAPLLDTLKWIRKELEEVEIELTSGCKALLEKIYIEQPKFVDSRFTYYEQRRFTHLLKLVVVHALARQSLTPTEEDIILANTVLYNAELEMPMALGEFGKSRFSEASHRVLEVINEATEPLTFKQIWKAVARDLDKLTTLSEIISNLKISDRIQQVQLPGKGAVFIPNKECNTKWPKGLVDLTLLREEERNYDDSSEL